MIVARFVFDQKHRVKTFTIRGHAAYAETGKDIYCSAVSAICQTVIGTLTEIVKAGKDFIYQLAEGEIECTILNYESLGAEDKISVKSLMFSAYIGIKQIEMIEGQTYLSIVKEEESS